MKLRLRSSTAERRPIGLVIFLIVLIVAGVGAVAAWADRSESAIEMLLGASGSGTDPALELPYKYISVGWIDWATVLVRELSENQRDATEAHFLLGMAAESAGDPVEAELAYRRILALPELQPEVRGAALTLLGAVYVREGRVADATPLLLEAESLNPDGAATHYWLGQAAEGSGDDEEALSRYEAAAEQAADWLAPLLRIAHLRNRRGEYAQAAVLLNKRIHIGSRDPEFHFHLAVSFEGMLREAATGELSDELIEALLDLHVDAELAPVKLKELALHAADRALQLAPGDERLMALKRRIDLSI